MLRNYLLKPFPFFLITSIVFLWPLSFLVFTLKNDALTYYYPIRTLISDALNNGELPLWTPFINMGYPLHADMQSGAWSPVIWIFSFLTNYSLAAFHYELIFYFTFAGLGFYLLCKELEVSKKIALAIAVAYQFSGFMIDSVQFFNCISAACYIPFVFVFIRRLLLQHRAEDALLSALFLFLLFTGGYPSLFIITGYTVVAYTLFIFFTRPVIKDWLKSFLPAASLCCVGFILLSLPAIISFYQHLPEIERGKGQALSVVLENSMNPSTILSLLTPFGTTGNDGWLNSSILMRSIYIGIIPLIFLVYAFFIPCLRKNKELLFFFFCALTMLGLAWGEFFFLRQAAYYVLPLMDSFRHPALFRLFTIFFFLLVSAVSLNTWDTNKDNKILKKIIGSFITIVLMMGVASFFFIRPIPDAGPLNSNMLKNILPQLNFPHRYLIQFPFLIAILLLSYFAIVRKKNTRLICMIIIADLFFATQLNMPVTVFGAKSFQTTVGSINRNKVKFPLPADQSIAQNSLNSSDENVMTGSGLPFTKKIGRNNYYITPGNLQRQEAFYWSAIKDTVFQNPVLYFPDLASPATRASDGNGRIVIKVLSANELSATSHLTTPGRLVYLQNNYHGWKAYVDGKQTVIFPVNITFMAIEVPAGDHTITFRYKPIPVVLAWGVSIFFQLLFIIYLVFSRRRSGKHQREMNLS